MTKITWKDGVRHVDGVPDTAKRPLQELREKFDAMLVAEVKLYGGIPIFACTPEQMAFREVVAELVNNDKDHEIVSDNSSLAKTLLRLSEEMVAHSLVMEEAGQALQRAQKQIEEKDQEIATLREKING